MQLVVRQFRDQLQQQLQQQDAAAADAAAAAAAAAPAAAPSANELAGALDRLKKVPDAAKASSDANIEALKEAARKEGMKSTKGSIQDRIAAANAQIEAQRNKKQPPNT